jgi:large subunit ribosomal protein L5
MMAKQDSKQKADGAKSKGKAKFQEKIVRKEPPRLLQQYNEVITKKLVEEFQFKNVMEIPKITKIVINVGLGEAIQNPRCSRASWRNCN